MSAGSQPLISCIMPTRDRRAFVEQSIWYFLRQNYPNKELIILDDGGDTVADLVPRDERVRYVRLDAGRSLGAKRNLGCEMSRGELVAHWDDDDWMDPSRLSVQVDALLAADADVVGLRDLLHYRLEAGEAWLYRYPPERQPWVAGCSLLYRRSAWAAHPFPEINVGEDTAFVFGVPGERVHAVADTSIMVALIHARNTGAKRLSDSRWERRPLSEVSRLLDGDRDFYVALRHGRPARSVLRAQPVVHAVTVAADFSISTGYGSMAEYLVLGMDRAGATVSVVPMSLSPAGLSAEFEAILAGSRFDASLPVLYFSWPRPALGRFQRSADVVVNTMYESSRLPESWVEQLNRVRALIVPTRFVARVCRESGVFVPIEVIPEGIDPAVYHYEERPEREGVTTLIVGPVDDQRKHTRTGIEAWKGAFARDTAARLIIKTQYGFHNYIPDDARIQYVDCHEPTRGISHWYRQADVLLALGNEGFGLPLVEGMATGLPVIALNSEGQADICEEAGDRVLAVEPAGWQSYDGSPFREGDVRAYPSAVDVARKLRWVAEHRNEAKDIGKAASAWAVKHRSIWAKGPAVLDVMEREVRPPRPLRRLHTLWVPSLGTPCGVAEYTEHLAASLTGMRVVGQVPDMSGVRVLHVQHEVSLVGDVELARAIYGARQARRPSVITEHTIGNEVRAWERQADALVALTERGADRLRARCPGQRVEYIPIGCPTWFPERKRECGRVIGSFGFLGTYKGFWHILDALRELPGTELLLFSHSRWPHIEEQWTRDVEGLPVRRIGDFLPVAEIARRLAAEADILVFWYDEISAAAASYAVRIGLATGVPVLTSPTSWFHDVQEATYQPDNLVEGIDRLLSDSDLRRNLVEAAQEYCHSYRWLHIAERHLALWNSLSSP